MKIAFLLFAALLLTSCNPNLPAPGVYTHTTSGEKITVALTGPQDQIMEKYPGRFTSADFIEAFAKTRSSQFINEGRPKYFAVIEPTPESGGNLRVIAVEILERDYVKDK